ncbi:hypothetical protein SAMN05660420_02099 [Desulfuromusa kysingii]|uniref:PcRGLX/YetA-like N-terminal RIFT barrel domain-containing protein n=1 Tax=Desulfuromusa kysingii TaxID=37625 RepID=A0A1H4BA28_9BACT|nr:hypothetical protein [Desulfuromusa kysingii]SEA45000.1 hypothetical protein SAMN05660420_02099 [Desulfuromusa kysingii]
MNSAYTVAIVVRENTGIERCGEPVRIGVPVPKGWWTKDSSFVISHPDGDVHPCQTQCLKRWPDGSIKWLLVDYQVQVPALSTTTWTLSQQDKQADWQQQILIEEGADEWRVDTGAGCFYIDTHVFKPFKQVESLSGDKVLDSSRCNLKLDGDNLLKPMVDKLIIEDSGPYHAVICLHGHFVDSVLHFKCRLHFYAGTMTVKAAMQLHNPQAAAHPHGLWDLGDQGSILFQSLSFRFDLSSDLQKTIVCRPEIGQEALEFSAGDPVTIYQESSGGQEWQSPNHRNSTGQVPLTFKGYRLTDGGKTVLQGERAIPHVWVGKEVKGVAVASPLFWQEFPKQIILTDACIEVSLFPESFPDVFELQGGEQKTHLFFADFSAERDSLTWASAPLDVLPAPEAFHASGVFADLPGDNDLVDQFVSAGDFIAKRELIDEYGWRNFGEIYADHEAVEHKGSAPFISHYNNQYDLLAGVYKKAFTAADFSWLKLAHELAAHVRDIDMYHTDQDREEYNHGLFWHTDHYVNAGLAGHRSYSREQKATYELHCGGGGPGSEHCYSSGFVVHYFQTGNFDFKEAVLQLAQWELVSLSGPQTILAATKRFVDNVRLWRSNSGVTKLFPLYPFTRGTGNAITTCLDAFDVSGDETWLVQIEAILQRTLHPEDDITLRDLLNVEIGWSYTVLLNAVAKYLDKKLELEQLDDGFNHARLSLLHYANWMLENEYPYLNKPEILEYPNETWAAQDLRKSVILYHAARYSSDENQQDLFVQKASFFYDYAEQELKRHKTSRLTRPIALILQNGWVGERLRQGDKIPLFSHKSSENLATKIPGLSLKSVIERYFWEFGRVIVQTNPKREVAWLKARLSS